VAIKTLIHHQMPSQANTKCETTKCEDDEAFYDTHFDVFAKNAAVKALVLKAFDTEYQRTSVPKWVNWKEFKADMLGVLTSLCL